MPASVFHILVSDWAVSVEDPVFPRSSIVPWAVNPLAVVLVAEVELMSARVLSSDVESIPVEVTLLLLNRDKGG